MDPRYFAVDRVEKLDEPGVAVPEQALADHGVGQDVQRSEQGRGAIAFVVMGHRGGSAGTVGSDAWVRSKA